MSHSLKNNEIISCHTVLLEQMMNEHTLPSEQINYLGKLKFLDMWVWNSDSHNTQYFLGYAVASLGLVSTGRQLTVSPIFPYFFPEKTGDLFSHHCQFCSITPIYFLLKNWRPFFFFCS